MELHLLSSFSAGGWEKLLDICRPYLEGQRSPLVAYLPAAALGRRFVRETKAAFHGLARVTALNPETNPFPKMMEVLERASLVLVPGGNTYVLVHRLNQRGLLPALAERVREGLPYIGFSAGIVLCGPNILTTNDINACGTTQFAGLGLVPFNLSAHYPPEDGPERESREGRIWEYHCFHENPVLALEDGAHLRVTGEEMELLSGNGWAFHKGRGKVQLGAQTSLARL